MLHRVHIVRFAFNHSPEKEQRVLYVAKDPDELNPDGSEQAPERSDPLAENPEPGIVDKLRTRTAADIAEIAPDMILHQEIKYRPNMLELLLTSGAVSEQVDSVLKDLGYTKKNEFDPDPIDQLLAEGPEKRELLVERVLEGSDEQQIIRIIAATNAEFERHKELMLRTEKHMKILIKNTKDPLTLEKTIYDMAQYDLELQSPDAKNIGGITPANIIEKIGVPLTDTKGNLRPYTTEYRQQIFEVVRDVARAISIKKSFGQPTSDIITGTEEVRQKRKTEFFTQVQDNTEILLKYLDTKINANAGKLLRRVDTLNIRLATESNGETLTSHDVSVEGVETVLVDTVVSLKKIRRSIEGDVRDGIYHKNGLIGAKKALETLERISTELDDAPGNNRPNLIEALERKESAAIRWANDIGARLSRMDRKKIGDINPFAAKQLGEFMRYFQPFMSGHTATPRELIDIRQADTEMMRNISETIRRIEENPRMFTEEELQNLDRTVPEDEVSTIIDTTRDNIESVMDGLLSTIDHPIARYLNIGAEITDVGKDILADLKIVESMRAPDATRAMLRRARIEAGKAQQKMERLKRCQQMLTLIATKDPDIIIPLNRKEYNETTGSDSLGFYSYENGRMYLNTQRIHSEKRSTAEVLEHEMGHAIIDTFRRSGVFPNIMLSLHEKLKYETTASGETFESLLVRQAPVWGIEVGNPASPTAEENWKMMDELVNRYSLWKENIGPERPSRQERELFSLCSPTKLKEQNKLVHLTGGSNLNANPLAQALQDGAEDPNAEVVNIEPEKVYEENLLGNAENKILNTDAFLVAYPEYTDLLRDVYEYLDVKALVKKARDDFKSGHYLADRERFLKYLKAANTVLDSIKKDVMLVVDLAKSDLTHETKTGTRSIWRVITEDVNWVSIGDVMTMFKDAGEDIQRMWKRRGEAARNRLGKGITEMISDDIPYLGRLKHEFERRDRESEEAEVSVWEKGLEKIDPHDLMHEMVPRVKTIEQLKAIINLVTKKGRLDWDDQHLWDKLEYFSGYQMPRTACLRNSDLRNQWLQKMAADIWRDKDIFEHWKAENDGAIDSGRKHLDTYVEELAATNHLRTELRRLLYNFTRAKNGEKLAKEEEVNPHLYEGIIYYAMRNGKMSMEEKFFYLVKGVDEGLLSVDRLRAFSGEAFGILNGFPFIDYFSTGQNCSKHEIKKISIKITEQGVGVDPFKPGARMTKFLMEEVAFDKNVSERVGKALKRGENIDHEDIPLLLTQMDFSGVNQLVNFTSGSQAKVSAQSMQNGYVGYNSFLKYFGMKATIGHPPITDRDVTKLASTLGAYSMWDNLITRNSIGAAASARPFLSWEQINDKSPVVSTRMTKEYRDAMNNFTMKLCQELDITQVNGIPINLYIGIDRQNPDTMAALRAARPGIKDEEIYKLIEAGPQDFVTQLRQKMSIPKNHAKLVEVLRSSQESFIPEADNFNIENVRQFWDNGDSETHHATTPAAH